MFADFNQSCIRCTNPI